MHLASQEDRLLNLRAATTDLYTLSLHDALPIFLPGVKGSLPCVETEINHPSVLVRSMAMKTIIRKKDRKSTRLNSSHTVISYAVFCLKKRSSCAAKTRYASDAAGV